MCIYVSGLEWLFGIEPVDEDDTDIKREIQQKRWHRVIRDDSSHSTVTITTEAIDQSGGE